MYYEDMGMPSIVMKLTKRSNFETIFFIIVIVLRSRQNCVVFDSCNLYQNDTENVELKTKLFEMFFLKTVN